MGAAALPVFIVLTAASTAVQMESTRQAGQAQKQAAQFQAMELEQQAEREKTQTALENLQREQQLRSILATQRARFGASGISLSSGTPQKLGEVAVNETLRQQRQAGFFSALTISSLNRQAGQSRMAGSAAASAANLQAIGQGVEGLASIAGKTIRTTDLIKPDRATKQPFRPILPGGG